MDLWCCNMPHHQNFLKLNTDFKFMCFCGFGNQVKADKTHFVAPRREGEFGLYLVCRTVIIFQSCSPSIISNNTTTWRTIIAPDTMPEHCRFTLSLFQHVHSSPVDKTYAL